MQTSVGDASARESFLGQANGCRRMGSEFTAGVCELLAERLDATSQFGARILGWPGDPRADALALRAAGGLNALARSGRAPGLAAVYPPNEPVPEALWAGIRDAIADHDVFLTAYLDSAPQTNEVKRCAVLLGGALLVAHETGLALDILEIGASAGLNLGFDRYSYDLGGASWGAATAPVSIRSAWRGVVPPLDASLGVATRRACDLNPIDPSQAHERERVMSYIWPDQAERLATTQAAFAAAAAMPWRVERADAADWVEARLAEPALEARTRLLMHTIMWQYLPQTVKQRITQAMVRAGATSDAARPLAWLRMEADEQSGSAAVTLTIWPGGQEREIARADFHGRWVDWR